jgi:RNA polymerase sigma factor (sigma-70 family)
MGDDREMMQGKPDIGTMPDAPGFEALVESHKGRLVGYLRCRLSGAGAAGELAEDLAQEAFMRAYRAMRESGFQGRSGLKTWLFVIADNCLKDHWRKEMKRVDRGGVAEQEQAAGGESDPVERAGQRESEERLREAIKRLPREQGEVVALKFFGGLTFTEMAEVTGEGVPTLKSRMKYALVKLQGMLAGQEGGGL